jgi:hypothetical protein
MTDHTEKRLLSFAEESTATIEREHWRYYYEADGYKFFNSHLANWYQRTTGSWVRFVVGYLPGVRATLASGDVYLDHDYDLDHMRRLTESQDVTCFFSGGQDSVYMLEKARRDGIRIGSVISNVFGDDLDHPVNQEVKHNAMPYMRENWSCGHRLFHHSLDFLEDTYQDPWYFLRSADFGGCSPAFRRTWDQVAQEKFTGICLFGPDKPEVVSFSGRWYSVLHPGAVFDHGPMVPKNSECLNRNVENIKSLVKDSLILRKHIIDGGLQEPSGVCFYKINPGSASATGIGRPILPTPTKQFDKLNSIGVQIWPGKEQAAIQHAVEQQRFVLIERYLAATRNLISVVSASGDPHALNKTANRFGWFIDLDTLEVYTQEELIPNGFPAEAKIINKVC